MDRDEIIAEVWRLREAYAAEHHHDLKEIVADLQKRQQHPDRPLAIRKPCQRPQPGTDASPRS